MKQLKCKSVFGYNVQREIQNTSPTGSPPESELKLVNGDFWRFQHGPEMTHIKCKLFFWSSQNINLNTKNTFKEVGGVTCLTALWRNRWDLERVWMGGAHDLVLILSGHFNGLADKWQLITGDHMVMHRAVSGCKGKKKYHVWSQWIK